MEERGCVQGACEPLAAHCELTRVLLLMILQVCAHLVIPLHCFHTRFICYCSNCELCCVLQPTPERIRPEHARMLEKYTWTSDEDVTSHMLGDTLGLLVQSLVVRIAAFSLAGSVLLLRLIGCWYMKVISDWLIADGMSGEGPPSCTPATS